MEKYGLYVGYERDPLIEGTKEHCQEHVRTLTDVQRERGWTVAPIPPEPYEGPYVDPAMVRRVWVMGIAFAALTLILAGALFFGRR